MIKFNDKSKRAKVSSTWKICGQYGSNTVVLPALIAIQSDNLPYCLTPKLFCMPTNFISLQTATTMTTNYRSGKENILKTSFQNQGILPICETFGRAAFDTILSDSNCQKVRVYLCLGTGNKVRVLVVGVNSNDEDILPSGTEDKIIEDGVRCPDVCPPPSALNGF